MPDFQFESLQDFLAMGGYAGYVWGSYGLFAVFMSWILIQPRLQRRKVMQLLQARARREAAKPGKPAGNASSGTQA